MWFSLLMGLVGTILQVLVRDKQHVICIVQRQGASFIQKKQRLYPCWWRAHVASRMNYYKVVWEGRWDYWIVGMSCRRGGRRG